MYKNPQNLMLVRRFQTFEASQLIGELVMLGLNHRGTVDQLRDLLIRYMGMQFRPEYRVNWNAQLDVRAPDELPYTLISLNAEFSFDPTLQEINSNNVPITSENTNAVS